MLLAAANSIAMSLGRHRGAAIIGRPLDLSVQAVLDAQDETTSLCLDADVFYADNKVDKSRVRVTAERVGSGTQDAVIRIRASSLVDEPVVTVYLRVGCQQKTERRYVTLADLASDVVADRNAVGAAVPPLQVSPPLVTRPGPASSTASLRGTQAGANTGTKAGKKTRKPVTPASEQVTASEVAVDPSKPSQLEKNASLKPERTAALAKDKPAVPNRPRLKLEPLDLSIDREPQLKSSAELLSAPASSPQERSAAAALWRAIAAQPQDIMRDFDKLQSLEASVRGLQAQNQKTQQSINELGEKLQKAETERYGNTLIYALLLFLLMALAGLAYLLRGRLSRRSFSDGDAPWWRKGDSQKSPRQNWADSASNANFPDSPHEVVFKKMKSGVSARAELAASAGDEHFSGSEVNSSKQKANSGFDPVPPLVSIHPDFALSMTHPSRAVKAEELFDVQQQADFFVSIGQHEQAIDVLRGHIADSVETSAVVYLDLFNLYHLLQRRDNYAALREEFNSRFNTKIPQFDLFTAAGPGLEAYQLAMSRIEALWPSPKVLEIIEESIFRVPENNAEAFNLEAYRELLMLYSVAKDIITPESKRAAEPKGFDLPKTWADRADSRRMEFVSTAIQPLSASIDETIPLHSRASLEPFLPSTVPPASLNLGLDLDLSEPMTAAEKRQSVERLEVSDLGLFNQIDIDANVAPSQGAEQALSGKSAPGADNLIDFDAFDIPLGNTEKFKPPHA